MDIDDIFKVSEQPPSRTLAGLNPTLLYSARLCQSLPAQEAPARSASTNHPRSTLSRTSRSNSTRTRTRPPPPP